jgi:hypothetical protein
LLLVSGSLTLPVTLNPLPSSVTAAFVGAERVVAVVPVVEDVAVLTKNLLLNPQSDPHQKIRKL